ncbi:alpha/beta hydrolase fold domain-containing protein [Puniceicoccus vermicola]|uniref:Alpha/beta hydrolase n=2 Tax=Puniceicoccus vermicola TaxID=388746 RepID=A0A7X1AZG7_9BACT|nr:alpha/beta hydrolase [Puniceicoccus vermicola]
MICLFVALAFGALHGEAETVVLKDVEFLPEGRNERMDVYLPDSSFEGPVPAILLIHGGGWMVGDKASRRERMIAETLSNAGYAVFSTNYLLNERDENKRVTLLAWPQNVIDCKTALRFIRAKAGEYGVDPERIAVMGGSAGGHLSMMVAATANEEKWNEQGLYPEEDNSVQCVVNLYGPADIRGKPVNPFSRSDKSVIEAHEEEASPITYFDSTFPPMLILQGTGDRTIPVEQTREWVAELSEFGFEYCYVEVAGAPHSFDLNPEELDLRPMVLAFLDKHLRGVGVGQ